MEHSSPHPLPRKRKASQSSPNLDPRCIPLEEPHASSDCALLQDAAQSPAPVATTQPSPLYNMDGGDVRKPKRPRLSLASPPQRSRSRRATPPRKRATSRPTPQSQPNGVPQQVCPTSSADHYHLHRRASLPSTNASLLSPIADSPVTPSPVSPPPKVYAPPLLPTITCDTLRELDLEAILRNPQLRHDLLFDPGLQFRPTTSRRKQLAADRYWTAMACELERGCTCTAWDETGDVVPCTCSDSVIDTTRRDAAWADRFAHKAKRTRPPTPPPWSDRYYAAYLDAAADPRLEDAHDPECIKDCEEAPPPVEFHAPSRVRPMLRELVAVLGCVIVPPPLPASHTSGVVPPRPALHPSSSDAQVLLTHLDPVLIEQELRRGIFDPAGLFGLVGDTLKRHCAPMRDRIVDSMVSVARSGEGTTTTRAVRTFQMCFEILELMKLDIANHQLQHLRPFLAASTPDFELRVFVERYRRGVASLQVAREWLQNAWTHTKAGSTPKWMAADKDTRVAAAPSPAQICVNDVAPTIPRSRALSRRTLVQLSLVHAITGLVFNLPSHTSSSASHLPNSAGYPETLYLDTGRVALLAADAADLTALYMLLMLWRQLVFWSPAGGENTGETKSGEVFPRYARSTPRLDDWEVDRVKREIWEVGPRRIGSCFFFSGEGETAGEEERVKWANVMQNVALQIAMRAEEARTRTSSEPVPAAEPAVTRRPPSQEALGLMSGWVQSHMRRDSALAGRLRELLRQEVAHVVAKLTFASEGGESCKSVPGHKGAKSGFVPGSGGGTAGLEPLMPEIRHLAQRIARLVLVNMRVYWSLYEAEGFLIDEPDVEEVP